ncbi:MAG: pyridoxamine 5'-phosphate oxidase family protein [Planctomycetota bacterium]
MLAPDQVDVLVLLGEVWSMLAHGAADRRRACHTPTLVTVDAGGRPCARTVVLRGVDPEVGTLRCHTDARSPKVDEITRSGWVSWHVYDMAAKVQLRCGGSARVEREGATVDVAWDNTPLMSRRCYLAPRAPGAPSEGPSANLPEALIERDPTSEESEGGRAHFAVVVCDVLEIEWLWLHHAGHRRAWWSRDGVGEAWRGGWLEP